MKQSQKVRYCKQCCKVIDNSGRRIQKRTKYCSYDCHEDYLAERRRRLTELNLKSKKGK